jgi:ribosomal subunit interface protein
MKLLLRGQHLSLTEDLKSYVQTHLVDHISRYYDDTAAELDVALVDTNGPKGGLDKEARVTFRSPHLASLHVTEVGADVYACVDLVRDRMERLVKREVERLRAHNNLEANALDRAAVYPDGLPSTVNDG